MINNGCGGILCIGWENGDGVIVTCDGFGYGYAG